MSKLRASFVRCHLPAPRALPGLGIVKGMAVPECAGLVFDTPAARQAHLEECHGGGEGKWGEVVERGAESEDAIMKEHRRLGREKGVCTDRCGELADYGSVRCSYHRARAAERRRIERARSRAKVGL